MSSAKPAAAPPFTFDVLKNNVVSFFESGRVWWSLWLVCLTLALAKVALFLLPRVARFLMNHIQHREEEKRKKQEVDGREMHFIHAWRSSDPDRVETLVRFFCLAVRIIIKTMATITVLGCIGLEVAPLIAGASVLGVALSFGTQSILKDFFGGFFIMLEDQYRTGDTVTIGTVTGVVEEMLLRTTLVRNQVGSLHYISHGSITTPVINHTSTPWQRVLIDVKSPWIVPVEEAREALTNAMKVLRDRDVSVEGPLDFSGGPVSWRIVARSSSSNPKDVADLRASMISLLQKSFLASPDEKELGWSKVLNKSHAE